MKIKNILTIVAFILCGTIASHAEDNDKGALYFTTPAGYQVMAVSANGAWACGIYTDDADNSFGFQWNLTTGKIITLGAGSANSVSNTGVVAGSFYKELRNDGISLEVAGLWKDGKWTLLEQTSDVVCSWAYGISPDGKHVTGTFVDADENYVSYVWEDGKILRALEAVGSSISYGISPDGKRVAGWVTSPINGNRACGYWETSDGSWHYLEPGFRGNAWQTARKFTSDGNKLLYWGDWHIDPAHEDYGYGIKAVYNFTTEESEYIYPSVSDPVNFDLYDISDKGGVVGYEEPELGIQLGIIWKDGEILTLEDYLTDRGADLSGLDDVLPMYTETLHMITRTVGVSNDENTFASICYDKEYNFISLVVALERDVKHTPPVNLEASQVRGLNVASLTWEAPVGEKTNLRGYNVYRNGVKVNADLVADCKYYDSDLAVGIYSYTVSAVYDESESKESNVVELAISDVVVQGPSEYDVRQRSYNSAYITWGDPATNLVDCNYYETSTSQQGFGGGTYSFEAATRFPAEQMNLYKDYRLTAVSFYPHSEQGSWLINIYTRDDDGALVSLGSFPIEETLEYGVKNTIILPRQITLQSDHELIVGIQANVLNSSYDVMGIFEGVCKMGYSDLIRQIGEDDFYSLNRAVTTSTPTYDVAWGTSALLAPTGVTADIDEINGYNVYLDGAKVANTSSNRYEIRNVTDGSHTTAVEAVYADGRISPQVKGTVEITANPNVFPAITPTVSVDCQKVSATWAAPLDNDATTLGYCSNTCGRYAPSTNSSVTEFLARTDFFTNEKFKGYDGYQINSISFYPLSDSQYDLLIYVNDVPAFRQTVEGSVTLKRWNTVALKKPVTIQRGKKYSLVINTYDCPEGGSPIAVDNRSAYSNYTNLYQMPGDDEWNNIDTDIDITGNWMMRLGVVDPTGEPFEVESYGVVLDGKEEAQSSSTSFNYEYATADDADHTLRVDATYTMGSKTVTGKDVTFRIVPTGINAITTSNKASNAPLYDVQGRALSRVQHGVNITRGGGKYIVR